MCKGCHIHVHGEDSVLDGLNKVRDLVLKAKSLGHTAVGLTDHGVCAGIPDLIKFANEQGIKPLPGVELYITHDHSFGSEEMATLKEEIMTKYNLSKKKIFDTYVRFLHRQNYQFDRSEVLASTNEILGEALLHGIPNPDATMNQVEVEPSLGIINDPDYILTEWRQDMYRMMDVRSFHLVVLAKNNKGLADLYEIVSEAHLNGFYSDPRISLSWIREHGLGNDLIATSACLGSYSSQLLMAGRQEEAITHLKECQETFGHFYLEKQATHIPEQQFINTCMDQLSPVLNIPKVLTTDVHYANKEDHSIHDIAVTAGIGKCVNDPDRMTYAHEFWMKSDEEMMAQCFDEEAWGNTLKIAEMIDVTLQEEPMFPKFISNSEKTSETLLRENAWQGLFSLCMKYGIDPNQYSQQLSFELDVICEAGFADYFLITEDLIKATNAAGYSTGPGRGSASGSLVCWAIGITDLDPIKEKLIFGRFMNPERASYPDVDIDFTYSGSQFAFNYLCEKYGYDKVSQIGTKGTLAARVVCRKVGKTLGYDLSIQDAFAKSIPDTPGIKLIKAYEESEAVKKFADEYPEWWKTMLALEGNVSSLGVHAAGVVLSPEKISRIVPLRRDKQGKPTTQFDMKWVEHFLVKFDLLKLDTLDLIEQTIINANLDDFNVSNIDLEDPEIYKKIYQTNDLSGIFQLEGGGVRKVVDQMKPSNFSDIGVICALYRPGPMDLIPSYIERKFGREAITYPFPELEPVLQDTLGIFCYQEQLMTASRILGGLTEGQSDMIRKGVAKKQYDTMNRWIDLMIYGTERYQEMHEKLVQVYPEGTFKDVGEMEASNVWVDYNYDKQPPIVGAIAKGFNEEKLLKMKKEWVAFGRYCFNRAH